MTLFATPGRWVSALLRGSLAGLVACLVLAFTGLAVAGPRALKQGATVTYRVLGVQVEDSIGSNIVQVQLPARASTLSYYTNASFTRTTQSGRVNERLYLQADAESCDRSDGIDQVTLRLYSQTLKTTFEVTAYETTVNSGIFRTRTDLTAQLGMVTTDDDMLLASLEGCGETARAELQVEPSGIVFDSQTGLPLAGARVTLIDVNGTNNGGLAGGPARLLATDGVTAAENGVLTGIDGRYRLGLAAPGLYRVQVVPAAGFNFPSLRAIGDMPGNRIVSSIVSYGRPFNITGDERSRITGLPDLPLDPLTKVLRVQLTTSRNTAEPAESVTYSATVRNTGESPLSSIVLAAQLPLGFAYVANSTRIDGQLVADPALPAGAGSSSLRWPILQLAPGASITLTWRVLVRPGALQGDGVLRIQAQAALPVPGPTLSNVASAKVDVQPGVFSESALLLGTVFADCNGNGRQDAGEPGAPGIRLVLQDGTFVVTDALGHYSLAGLRPRTQVIKIDSTSLPAGAEPVATSQRHMGDGHSRFIDPRPGQIVRGDFALRSGASGCSPDLLPQLAARAQRQRGDRELDRSAHTELTPDGATKALGDVRALQASGLIGERTAAAKPALATSGAAATGAPAPVAMAASAAPAVSAVSAVSADSASPAASAETSASAASAAPAPSAAATAATDALVTTNDADASLEQLAERLDNKLDFIDLQDTQSVANQPLLLRTKGRAGAMLTLEVNGVAIGADRIGQKVQVPASQLELREYVGVQLRPGRNTLTLTERDGFGNVRAQRSVVAIAPGALARIALTLPTATGQFTAPSDGETVVPVVVELLDRDGQRVGGRSAITLDASLGQWDVQDTDPLQAGVQTFVDGGKASFGLRAPASAGDAEIKAAGNGVSETTRLRFEPALRPMIAVGVVEGVFNLRKLKPGALQSASTADGFDAELSRSAAASDDGRNSGASDKTGARAAVYLKGKVRGDALLTLGYESDKDRRQRLFRDIQPDAFYPVYGDDAVKGFDAQSTSRLYVRLERGATALLYGDFSTQSLDPARQLGAYQRSLTGARLTQAGEAFSGSVWGSRDSTRQQVVEQRGNGTSGPYDLGLGTVLAKTNSERIEIIVRDRDQPARVLRSTLQQRFVDYDFDPLSGRLLMRAPVPSTDADLNPVFLRVTVEVDQGGMPFWVAGADGRVKLADRFSVGGSFVKDDNPLAPFQMASASASVKLAERTTLVGEVARTRRDDTAAIAAIPVGPTTPISVASATGSGDAQRIELLHESTALRARAFAARADGNFSNASSTLSAGRQEAGFKADYKLDERTRLIGEGLHSADLANGRRRDGALMGWERSFEGGMKGEIGLRHVTGSGDAAATPAIKETSTAVRAKFSTVIPALPNASAFVEAEQDLRDSDKHMAAVGGDLQLGSAGASAGRLYVRHEFISSMTGPYSLDANQRRNTTLLGIDAAAPYDGRAFGEYRLREGISGREAEAAMGLRNRWTVAEGLRLNTSVERVQALQGVGGNESAAATAAIEYTRDPRFKATGRIELRNSTTDRSLLATTAAAWKLGDDWTMLGRAAEALNVSKTGQPDREQQRLQLGMAYRDSVSSRINGLARYEFKRETGLGSLATAEAGARSAHIVSSHGDWAPSAGLTVSGQVAAKWVTQHQDAQPLRSNARLVAGRVTRDIAERWDVGVNASVLAGAGSRARSVGAEAGYRVQENLWLSVGYNARGYSERDLATEQHTQQGAYVRLRFKFDERTFTGARGN